MSFQSEINAVIQREVESRTDRNSEVINRQAAILFELRLQLVGISGERDALQQKLDAVVAKGMELAQEAAHVYAEYNKQMAPDVVCDGQTIQEFHDLAKGLSSVEAYLNSVRAEGIEILTDKLQQLIDEGTFDSKEIGVAAGAVHEGAQIAAQLRTAAPKGDSE